jgi:predicted Zn-dependent protease
LAHTFLPAPNPDPTAGDLHINSAIAWNIGQDTDLYSVLLHELGHALGMPHNSDNRSVMYPYYRIYSGLASIDVDTWSALYQ